MARFPFTDLHSFKDFVGFVQISATVGDFPERDGLPPDEQWTLDLAFEGLRLGLKMAEEEKGPKPVFVQCKQLVEEAYAHYRQGQMPEGYKKLDEMQKLLRKIPSQ